MKNKITFLALCILLLLVSSVSVTPREFVVEDVEDVKLGNDIIETTRTVPKTIIDLHRNYPPEVD